VSLSDVAAWDNLAAAFWRAARGKRHRPEVRRYAADLDTNLASLRRRILAAELPEGAMEVFEIHDPKRRTIHAPCFPHRVLHHAFMHHLAPVIERSLVADTFACIPGRGTLAAVLRAQAHARRYPWYAKIDVAAYFASIDHMRLLADLHRRFKDRGVLLLCQRIIEQHHTAPGRGLPIGALTSQCFANLYLAGLDRVLLERLGARAMVRYMDDSAWWAADRQTARGQLDEVIDHLAEARGLAIKPTWQINRSTHGLRLCGFRVLPWSLRLSQRRRRRYRRARARWETLYQRGTIDANALQRGYDSALAITAHADAVRFRRLELERRPPPEA
jgi:hypothetical protein